MPAWIAALAAISFASNWILFVYARNLAHDDGETDGAKPLWLGGMLNYRLVGSVLKKHSEDGDLWARRAYWAHCVVGAIVPVLIATLFVQQLWSR